MSPPADRLYELLPAVHRARDAERGYPLRALLGVINEQVDVVEEDISRLYDNWFIETCEDWVVPYVADLIGYRPVAEAGRSQTASVGGRSLNTALIPRREVANTLGFRRRKGTLALLELLARDVADWPARAVEFYKLLGWTQHLNHRRPNQGRTVDLRDGDALGLLGGSFERLARSVDVRRVTSRRAFGRHNIPSVGVFVWRLKTYSVSCAPACCIESIDPQCFTFSALGHDTPLYAKPEPESEPSHIAEEINLPAPIRRRAVEERLALRPLKTQASAAYYGVGKSLVIYAPDWPVKGAPQPAPRDRVIPADLSDWRYRAERGQIAIDPVLGRMVFPAGQLPKRGVWASYRYAFSADMGGGEYTRTLTEPAQCTFYRVTKHKPASDIPDAVSKAISQCRAQCRQEKPPSDAVRTIKEALAKWRREQEKQAKKPEPADEVEKETWQQANERLRSAVIEICDSAVYREQLVVELKAGENLQIRGANGWRPLIRLLDYMTEQSDAMNVSGEQGSRLTLDGLIVTGRGLRISGPDRSDSETYAKGDLCDVRIRHCTLVPGWGLESDCAPKRPNEPSIELADSSARLVIEHSIVGSIEVVADEVRSDPVEIAISDSIVDATSFERAAISASNLPFAFARLSIKRSTVLGEVHSHAISAAEDSIFMGFICVARRQIGCMRFCYVTLGSRTPRRYQCQPDGVLAAIDEAAPIISAADLSALKHREVERVRPRFTSTRYGHPAYGQLACDCAEEIERGAEDESEMGGFHDLFQPQREANLRARIDEYTPAGMDVGIIFAN